MLDIRATHYISPLSEIDFASVPLTVHIVNVADETSLVTGKFRVYNDTTGLLIHTSDIALFLLAAGAAVDASALTDFDPPAPADNVYFVIFDGHASNALVPDGTNFTLGAFYFDVKPVGMGPAPATHHLTHEEGGGDEIEVADMGTAELDDTLVLQPDGAGGVEWAAAPVGVTDHGALTGLADDDHPQYLLRSDILRILDFWNNSLFPENSFWYYGHINSGTTSGVPGTTNHPGLVRINSSINANSGWRFYTYSRNFLIAGTEESTTIINPGTLAGTTLRIGFHDTVTSGDAANGVYFEMAQVGGTDGVIVGKTANNSVRSTTGTNYTLVTGTWYRMRLAVNSNATRVDFYLYSEAGALLWTDFITTNIPTAAGREVGHAIIATNSATSAVALCDLDYMDIKLTRTLTR